MTAGLGINMWLLLSIELALFANPPHVSHVHVAKIFQSQKDCIEHINMASASGIPEGMNLGCVQLKGFSYTSIPDMPKFNHCTCDSGTYCLDDSDVMKLHVWYDSIQYSLGGK